MEYEFTTDWFSWSPPVWSQIATQLPERKKILEVGSWEGRSTVWLVEHMLEDGGKILCIDTWEGGEEHGPQGHDMNAVEQRFHKNITIARQKFPNRAAYSFRTKSSETLGIMNSSPRDIGTYDFIYIDGSHQSHDVLTDACMAWPLLKLGGVMAFDDYGWGEPLPPTKKPKIAIDAFVEVFKDKLHLIHKSYQLIVQKVEN